MAPDPPEALVSLARIARAFGASAIAEETETIRARIAEGRCYVACVGQFKRGKSTLINALVGAPVVPTGVLPVTSVPLVVRHGPAAVRVRFGGGWEELAPGALHPLVTEAGNPGNARGVRGAEVFVPSPLLQDGLCLVDTPGLGSIAAANDAATLEVIPRVDAAMLVTGPEPPITGDELELARALAREGVPLLAVVSKADRMAPADRATVRAFTRCALAEAGVAPLGEVLEVSAVAPRDAGANPDWPRLLEALTRLQSASGRALLRATLERSTRRLAGELRALLVAERRALKAPIEETAARCALLERLRDEAWRAARDLGPLLGAELKEVAVRLGADRARFLRERTRRAHEQLARCLDDPVDRRAALESANLAAREQVVPWLAMLERQVEEEFRVRIERFAHSGAELGGALAREAGVELPGPADAVTDLGKRRFQFHDRLRTRMARGSLLDPLLPRRLRSRRVAAAAGRYLDDLLEVNASRVEGDLAERVAGARAGFEAALRRRLDVLVDGARRAEAEARTVLAQGAAAVGVRLARLEAALAEVAAAVPGPTG